MYEITPDLWICKNKYLKKINLNKIIHIDCEKDLHYINRYNECNVHDKETVLKRDLIKVYYYVLENIKRINSKLMDNEVVIVSCDLCETLSPLIINSFLVKYGKLNIQESILCLESKTGITIKDDIFFNNIIKKIYNDSKK